MKIRILDRILVALSGTVLIGACAGLIAQVYFGKNVIRYVKQIISPDKTGGKILAGVIAALLMILGVYCLMVLFRHRRRKDKFILQRLESGDLAISLKTLETMVRKCVDQHPEIKADSIYLENQRDGLLVRIRGTVAGGISIPLTADTLQKQVKQYVTACSGVEVKGIRIQIESSGEEAKNAPFAIVPPVSVRLMNGNEDSENGRVVADNMPDADSSAAEKNDKEPDTNTDTEAAYGGEGNAAAAAIAAAESLMNGIEPEEDDRPIHQRIFSPQEEPCIMPMPPENHYREETEKTEETESDKKTDVSDEARAGDMETTTETAELKGEKENEKN